MMALRLYKLDASPPARAVMMTAEKLGLTLELKNMNTLAGEQFSPEYLKVNPQHTIPTLVDGDFVIWDSHAICAYLSSKYGKDDSLYPKDFQKRATVDQRLHFDSGILFPLLKSTYIGVIRLGEKPSTEAVAKVNEAYEFLDKFLDGKNWLAGDNLTIADICCVATTSSLDCALPVDSKFSNLTKWLKNCSEQSFFKNKNVTGMQALYDLYKSKLPA